jgi:hypothetical protein
MGTLSMWSPRKKHLRRKVFTIIYLTFIIEEGKDGEDAEANDKDKND